jgi:hypothetical protein
LSSTGESVSAFEGWDEVALSHIGLSVVDLRFREMAQHDPACLDRATFREIDNHNSLLKYGRQPWPTFISRAKVDELARVSVAICNLVRSVPARIFGGDPDRLAGFYGIDPSFARIIASPPDGIATGLTRGDFIHSAAGFQCAEFNMTSNLGGWETGLLADMLLQVAPIRRFVAALGQEVRSRNTLRLMLAHIVREVTSAGVADREINVAIGSGEAFALAADPKIMAYLAGEYAEVLREHAPGLSGRLSMVGYHELSDRGGAVYYRGSRLHALVERHDMTAPVIFRSFKAGGILLFNGPASTLLSDKRNLALLSEQAESDLFTAEEREMIRRHLPWSRRVLPGKVTYKGESVSLETLLRARKQHMVLKKARSMAGAHVMLGRYATPQEWNATLLEALRTGAWVVQEYVASEPYLFQHGERGCCPHDAVWGPFVFGDTYAGTILRVQPKEWQGIVNLTRGATEGVLLEVDDPAPDAGSPR